jgi:hypothetical protein
VIRFSAALVVVAIGVLIGGIVASELLLVYIAIGLSAVALVALATGVALKRGELFGEGQGLAPAQAGASPGLPGRSGEVLDRVTPSPLQGAVAGPGAAFAAHREPGPRPASSPSAATPETQPGHDSWGAPPAVAPALGIWPASAASGAATGRGTAAPSVFAPRTAGLSSAARPAAGQAVARPSWFNPAERAASPEAPAATQAPASESGWSWLKGETAAPDPVSPDSVSPDPVLPDPVLPDPVRPETGPAAAGQPEGAAALDDDWPTRYSWLDDEPEEDGGAGAGSADAKAEDGPATPADAAPESDSPGLAAAVPDTAVDPAARAAVTGQPSGDRDPGDGPGGQQSWPPLDGVPAAAAPVVTATPVPGTASAATTGTGLPDPGIAEPAAPETVESPALRLARDPDPGTAAAEEAAEPEGEPPAPAAGDTSGLVSVVRGVPRFHREDCVLIRFMPENDTQKMPVAQAREAGCTPCTACEPEG